MRGASYHASTPMTYLKAESTEPHVYNESTPERKLMCAILDRAVRDLYVGGSVTAEVIEWFTSKESEYIFTFKQICETIEVDARFISSVKKAIINVRPSLSRQLCDCSLSY